MANQLPTLLDIALKNQSQLLELLEGADYCLDWRSDPSDWSLREVVYHLLDTPTGGLPLVVKGMMSGELKEYDLWGNLTNMTPEREGYDLERVRQDVKDFSRDLKLALAGARDSDLFDRKVLVHIKTGGADQERTLHRMLERGFDIHWQEHLPQVKELREALGL